MRVAEVTANIKKNKKAVRASALLFCFSWYKESGRETCLDWWGLLFPSSSDENLDVQFDVMVDGHVWVLKMCPVCVFELLFFLQVWKRDAKKMTYFSANLV